VVRQFDLWLKQASKFRESHPEVPVPVFRWEVTAEEKASEEPKIEAAMNRLLDGLGLPHPPYPLKVPTAK
jgi:hypothetical protein